MAQDGSPAAMVKEKLNVAEVLKAYIEVQSAGRNFKARCPFHHEKTPSLIISPDRGTWHCFGCGEGGDIFSFVQKIESVEFGEALKILAEKAGIELRRVSPLEYKQFGLLYDLNAAARDFFRKIYAAAPIAQEYLKGRGLTPETIEEFEVGWAPAERDELSRHLVNFGYAPEDVIRAGLAVRSDKGMMFDRFRGRIMFPIWNHSGKVIGFTGRILPQFDTGEVGKYVNSPETPIFQKSKILYGFSKAKQAIRDQGGALMVEGQMDMIMTWQSGVKCVLATSGTALTQDHLQALRRLTERLVLSFDNDSAGYAALERGIDLAEALDFDVKVAVVEGYKDAAEAVVAEPGYMEKLIRSAKPAPQFYFERYLPEKGLDLKNREGLLALRKVLLRLKSMASAVERSEWMDELAKRTGLSLTKLQGEMEKLEVGEVAGLRNTAAPAAAPETRTPLSRKELLVERIIAASAAKNDFTLAEDVVEFFPKSYCEVWDLLKSGKRSSTDAALDTFINTTLLVGEELAPREFDELKMHLRREYFKERRDELTVQVKQFEREGNESELAKALQELSSLPKV
jgi:DNA primase